MPQCEMVKNQHSLVDPSTGIGAGQHGLAGVQGPRTRRLEIVLRQLLEQKSLRVTFTAGLP